jgi:predicted acylesterase/phospholipase RssA
MNTDRAATKERKLKRAIALTGHGPAAGLHIGVLGYLKNAGIDFDVWALSGIGAWVGVVYNQADEGKELNQTYEFFRNQVFREDLSYKSFPMNSVFTPDWSGNAEALMNFLLERNNYRNLLQPRKLMESFVRTMSFLSDEESWSEGELNRRMLNDVLAVNPFVRFWCSLIFKSNVDGLFRTYYSHSRFLNDIKFDRLYNERKPSIILNAWNLSKQQLLLQQKS